MPETSNGKQLSSAGERGGGGGGGLSQNIAGRKAAPVQIRDDTDVLIMCACLSLADRECPLLGVAVLSHPHELTLLTSTLGGNLSRPIDW